MDGMSSCRGFFAEGIMAWVEGKLLPEEFEDLV